MYNILFMLFINNLLTNNLFIKILYDFKICTQSFYEKVTNI